MSTSASISKVSFVKLLVGVDVLGSVAVVKTKAAVDIVTSVSPLTLES